MGTMLRLTTIPRHCSPRSLTTTLLLSVSTNLRTLDTHRSGVQTSFVVGLFHLAWCPQVYLCYSIIAYVRISFLLRLNVFFGLLRYILCSVSTSRAPHPRQFQIGFCTLCYLPPLRHFCICTTFSSQIKLLIGWKVSYTTVFNENYMKTLKISLVKIYL